MKILKIILKSTISIIFIIIIVNKIDLFKIKCLLSQTNIYIFLTAFLVLNIANVLNLYRLTLFYPKNQYSISFSYMLSIHYISYFFSLILPGRIGGDLNRALRLMQLTDEKSKTIVIILIWRIIGMTSLFFIASIALFINVYMKKFVDLPLLFIGSVWIILIWLLFFLFVDIRVIVFILEKIQRFSLPFKRKIDFLFASLRSVLSKKDILIKNLAFSITSHCTIIFCYYILSLSIKSDIPIFLFFIFTPIVGVIQQIPITIGGIGLREGSYVFLFIAAGKSPEMIISITLLYYIISLMIGAIGCCLLIFKDTSLKKSDDKPLI